MLNLPFELTVNGPYTRCSITPIQGYYRTEHVHLSRRHVRDIEAALRQLPRSSDVAEAAFALQLDPGSNTDPERVTEAVSVTVEEIGVSVATYDLSPLAAEFSGCSGEDSSVREGLC